MGATAVHVRSQQRARRRLLPIGDERLVARVRAGDDAAFEIIYDRYYRGLLAFCGHMLGSRQEAEDALQHSFASAYRALRGGAGAIELRPWLYTIARNRCLSALRAQRAQVPVDGTAAGAGPFEGLPAQIQQRADLRELVEELQRLPDDQRAALVLFELGDESHEQIAAVLGVRREKVKALVFQAREALMRARTARATPCVEIREQLASLAGRVPRRSMARTHIDRCPGCAQFERDVRRQRAALAAILPMAPTVGLKASVLGFTVGGGGAVALGGAGAGGGATVAAGGAFAGLGVGGGGAAGTAAAGTAAAGTAAAGALSTAGAATVASGLATAGGGGLASLPAKAVVAKVLAVVALGGGGAQSQVPSEPPWHPVAAHQPATTAPVTSAPSQPPAAAHPPAPAANEPAAAPPASAPPPAAPAVPAVPAAPSHTSAAPAPAASPALPGSPSSPASAEAAQTSAPGNAPAATAPPTNAGTAPSAPASQPATPPAASNGGGAPQSAPPPATSSASAAAPAGAAPADSAATTSTAAPVPPTPATPATAAVVAAPGLTSPARRT